MSTLKQADALTTLYDDIIGISRHLSLENHLIVPPYESPPKTPLNIDRSNAHKKLDVD